MPSALRQLPKIDPHHHLWDIVNNPYPWLTGPREPRFYGDYGAICRNYLIPEFLADIRPHNVVQSVHVQANWDMRDPVAESRWVQSVADTHGYPHGIVGFVDLGKPDAESLIKAHAQFPNMRGIRQILGTHPDPRFRQVARTDLLNDPAWVRNFARLAKYGLAFDLMVFHRQLRDCVPLAKGHSDIPIILEHSGMPDDRTPEGFKRWQDSIQALAACPNVTCKLSGLGLTGPGWTLPAMQQYCRALIAAFGPERCMFASNFPVDRLFSTFDQLYDAFYAVAEAYAPTAQKALFHDTAKRVYRL